MCIIDSLESCAPLGNDATTRAFATRDTWAAIVISNITSTFLTLTLGTHESSPDRPVLFLQHGVFSDSFAWTGNLANESAAFVFADAGFDVWMANSRGTPSSQKHIGYGPDEARFWNFTWQDMCTFDLTSSIDYVLNTTKTGSLIVTKRTESLYFVGHSQGTVLMFAKLAGDPDYAKK
ncbi:hypothetical protein OSTOST_20183, partial [Ostertagia ostertagi]